MLEFIKPVKVYGAKLKDKEKLLKSQSGGAFTAIAEFFLSKGAIVYGCSLDDKLNAVYARITSFKDLEKVKGSKYVQAKLGDTLKNVLKDLESDKIVLFSGTPCYVAACKQFIDLKKYGNQLFVVDIICHGVPSPLVYKAYLDEVSKKENCDVQNYIFRYKSGGDKTIERIIYSNGKEELTENYIKLFYTNLALRPSCGKCQFAKIERVSDFTIGDFWGIKNSFPDFSSNDGVSVILCNNERAVKIFSNIQSQFDAFVTDIHHALQPNLKKASKVPFYRYLFWKDFYKHGVLYCSKKWSPIVEFPNVLKQRIKMLIKR
ncbi:Coenzyme F420 hydrogenase/dehydrogenase, beta subunit C-terminal domain [Holdemanella porci]|uniref:Coenzyme F420 hydrogenase/dehydrogenase, beta subunit C-terminal domain n=3 Tax=Holdemanella porci TaxID=2652276 RepID=UPI003FD750FA